MLLFPQCLYSFVIDIAQIELKLLKLPYHLLDQVRWRPNFASDQTDGQDPLDLACRRHPTRRPFRAWRKRETASYCRDSQHLELSVLVVVVNSLLLSISACH